MSTDNPFAPPQTAADRPGADDISRRMATLPVERRLIAVGILWVLGSVVSGAMTALSATLQLLAGLGGGDPVAVGMGLFSFLLCGLWVWFALEGLRLQRLEPVLRGRVAALAVAGICLGPCSCMNLFIPFAVLGEGPSLVLSQEHAALRARTPQIKADGAGWAAAGVALMVLLLMLVFLPIAIIGALTALGDSLSSNFEEISSDLGEP